MHFESRHIPYQDTSFFTPIVKAYLSQEAELKPFYSHQPTLDGVRQAIVQKQQQPVDRKLLVTELQKQYATVTTEKIVTRNIEALLSPNTFTVCTAHQPNLFTGPLYFIYKILHAIKLADYLNEKLSNLHFVPVYYMGSEDADFAELNHTYVEGKRIEWHKEQSGAVGRMTVDKSLIQLIGELEGQLYKEPYAGEMTSLLRNTYTVGKTIQEATFELVNVLYGRFGLVVLIPDNSSLKHKMKEVFLDDLFSHQPASIVQDTSGRLERSFKVQAYPRDINLFYLKGNIRERIIRDGDMFTVHNTDITFSSEAIRLEVEQHPERFSPNVILRGLFQETILPNIAFIGGGGELAYWLQLKDLFSHYHVVYPVLLLRNSFMVIDRMWKERIDAMGLEPEDLFESENELMNRIVEKYSGKNASLNGNLEVAERLYSELESQAGAIDPTLTQHVAAIKVRAFKLLHELEKKMVRAEKRKYSDQQRQIQKIRNHLFPNNGLQERTENISGFYAKWGAAFLDQLLLHSKTVEGKFTILSETE